MQINNEGNTPTTDCVNCGTVELVMLTISGTGLHCPCGSHVGYVGDLLGTGVEECHLIKIA